ncbi:MAG: DUF72 domain-containing protein [Actinobacteria bacterium]|nr:DUF72 domain-containing protein [Actinomycetota bacterium]
MAVVLRSRIRHGRTQCDLLSPTQPANGGWQRYDYTYSEDELREWVPKLRQLDSELPITLVYANNQYRGQSVDALRALRGLLAEEA